MRRAALAVSAACLLAGAPSPAAGETVHVWEKVEIPLAAEGTYANPYAEVEVWVDLEGPGFRKRVHGFWDGGSTFRVRVVATAPGIWRWRSGSRPDDPGLRDRSGSFRALAWTEAEKAENPCRRGFIRPTANGRALRYADGTPFFLLGDTWWATPTFRYPWHDDDDPRPIGPAMGFKDYVRYRKAQGFNCVAIIAAHPAWANDGAPASIVAKDGTVIRRAWRQAGTKSAKDMHNEGGRPFLFPGRVPGFETIYPDVNRINPAYFRCMDRKIDYLNAQGFVPFIEPARRDASQAWKKYYGWPESYARYVRTIWSRYGANSCILSPIHFDTPHSSIPPSQYNEAANRIIARYGPPPFGQLVGANPSGTARRCFGGPDRARWLTLNMAGNGNRNHEYYDDYLTEDFFSEPARPCVNGEPYYAGWHGARGDTEEDNLNCRSAMYGSVLSGGLGGHIYGAHGMWGGDREAAASVKMWESLQWTSGAQMRHLRTFVTAGGFPYGDLVPARGRIAPNETGSTPYRGWAFGARTADKRHFLIYFEKGCRRATLSGALPAAAYATQWFDPREGLWIPRGARVSDATGRIALPPFPRGGGTAATDWGMRLAAR